MWLFMCSCHDKLLGRALHKNVCTRLDFECTGRGFTLFIRIKVGEAKEVDLQGLCVYLLAARTSRTADQPYFHFQNFPSIAALPLLDSFSPVVDYREEAKRILWNLLLLVGVFDRPLSSLKPLGSMLDEEQSQNCTNGSLNNTEHAHGSVIDKQCDDNTVKDISVDEGVLEKHQCFQSTQANSSGVLLEVPSTSVECQVDVDNLFDFDSLLDLAETGNNQTQEIPDHTSDKSYLDELLATSNNPFLEDSPLERCLGAEKEAANAVHPSNPFNIDVTLSEYEGNNSTGPDEASNKFYTQSDVIEGVISSKNPFLDTSSFKLAMDDFKQAEKTSGNGVTVDGAVIKEMTTHADEKETTSNGKDEAPSITSQVSSQGASEKMKVPEQCNSPPANGSQLQHEPLESSFASINPYPALVSYSGQIPFSGSMSRRSESSATSNRSFAFPVLQTELKASPVRMAKADRKHNSWKALLCCNF